MTQRRRRSLLVFVILAVACCGPPGAPEQAAERSVALVRVLVQEYIRIKRACPPSIAELRRIGIESDHYVDPWGTELRIVCGSLDPEAVEVLSAGPDREFGNEDDLRAPQ